MAIPTDIAGLQAWFKADVGTSTTTDGVAISQWNDQSGNAHHLTQATGTKQPLYKAAILNGLPVVRFDGVDDAMAVAFTLIQPATYFYVFVFRAAFPAHNEYIMDGAVLTDTQDFARTADGSISLYAGTALITGTGQTEQSWHYYSAIFNGASSQFWTDGVSQATGNPGAGNPGGITLGSGQSQSSVFAAADIGEMFAFNTSLSTTDRQSMEAYLLLRWFTAAAVTGPAFVSEGMALGKSRRPLPMIKGPDTDTIMGMQQGWRR